MGIRTSSLPNLGTPTKDTILLGVNVIDETPNNSVKITAANLQSFIVSSSFLKANQSFIKANAAYDEANSSSSYANSSFDYANSAYLLANSCLELINTTANTLSNSDIKLSSAYNFANNLNLYIDDVYDISNVAIEISSNSYIKANASFAKANDAYDYADSVNNSLQQIYDTANSASIAAQYANTNSIVAFDAAESATSLSQTANTNAGNALNSAISAVYIASNTEIKLGSCYDQSNTINNQLQTELSKYPIINVKRYDVSGDGITDDTGPIQSLIDSTYSGSIFFPSGEYLISSSLILKPNMTVRGEGATTVFLTGSNNTTIFEYTKPNEFDDNVTITNLSIKSDGYVNCSSISVRSNTDFGLCKNITLTGIRIFANSGYNFSTGITVESCKDFFVSSIISSNCVTDINIVDSIKGQIINNILNSETYNIVESGDSNKNIICGNITRSGINIVGANTINSNNIENVTE